MEQGYLYILESILNGKYYIGSTTNLLRRIYDHNTGNTPSTKSGRPWKLVFSLQIGSLSKARTLELKLEKHKSRKILEQIVKDQEIRMLK